MRTIGFLKFYTAANVPPCRGPVSSSRVRAGRDVESPGAFAGRSQPFALWFSMVHIWTGNGEAIPFEAVVDGHL